MMYGRNLRQLFITWGTALLFLVVLSWLERTIPALHEILLPGYWLVIGATAFFTWRWVRGRGRRDRRGDDRRNSERRADPPESAGS